MPQQHSHVVIIGGGIMGGDIATVFAADGWKVDVMSPSEKTRAALPARLATGLEKLGADKARAANVATHASFGSIEWASVGLVVEAATEDLALKQKLFADLERLVAPDVPLAS